MVDMPQDNPGAGISRPAGWEGIVADWSSDQRAFKNVSWGKAISATHSSSPASCCPT
jgi:cytochrome c oxidase subunit 3